MSKAAINQYYNNYDRAVDFGKSKSEMSIRNYFWILLNDYARQQNYEVVTERTCQGTTGKAVRPDGLLKNRFGLDIGIWESKDERDTLEDEIDAKRKKGYPFTNILFEDGSQAVLFQRGEVVLRANVREASELHALITKFVTFKSETIYKFEEALENFKADIPAIVETLRARIELAGKQNTAFIKASHVFLELCRAEINPEVTPADVREMMIQHILTSDIFSKVFDDPDFHRHNTIARELEVLIEKLFTYSERKNLLGDIEHYYETINAAAAGITDHHEKQKFLKVLYENFYKVYNPKAADRLGVVYTPNEVVNFMVESTDYLLEKHFGKNLPDKDVDILDPATGTGTYISAIIDFIPKQHLAHKYHHELHANEVAILPYYIANLNIEFTYKQKMGAYAEFENICFVDTLDNTASLAHTGKQHSLFGVSSENAERIKRQNSRKISVIIGNPPYNANQANENDNNKNREYPNIDKRIKDTFIKYSTAQKTKVYDMYARFYRYAMDRLDRNGIVAFITNRSFIDSRTFDGFRKIISDEFSNAYIIDTLSDVRANTKIAGSSHNVFGIQTGVAIMFLVKKQDYDTRCRIEYFAMDDNWRKEEKLEWLRTNKLKDLPFHKIIPDNNFNWISQGDGEFNELIPLINRNKVNSIFDLFTNGVATNRDEWVYDFDKKNLIMKVNYFEEIYNDNLATGKIDESIKWSRDLRSKFNRGIKFIPKKDSIIRCFYRPFIKKYFFAQKVINDVLTQNHLDLFGKDLRSSNKVICYAFNEQTPLLLLAINSLMDLNFCARGGTAISLYRYDKSGTRHDNLTDWGLEQFRAHYQDKNIIKEDIFHYTYAVLHHPAYRSKYELNLKREFPRLPFYTEFHKWAAWGKQLMELHINYEKAEPYLLQEHNHEKKSEAKAQKALFSRVEEPEVMFAHKAKVKPKLKVDKAAGIIEIDELTFLRGVPPEAWEYKLGNRSALEWVLDQYKEKKPKDPTIAEKFNTYRFSDYKQHVIDLLKRVCTVSVETMKIIGQMPSDKA